MNIKSTEDIFNELSPIKGNIGLCKIRNCDENMKKTYIELMSYKCKNIKDPNCENNINTWMNNYVNGEGFWPGQTSIEPPKKTDIYLKLKIITTILIVLFLIFILSVISFLASNKMMKK